MCSPAHVPLVICFPGRGTTKHWYYVLSLQTVNRKKKEAKILRIEKKQEKIKVAMSHWTRKMNTLFAAYVHVAQTTRCWKANGTSGTSKTMQRNLIFICPSVLLALQQVVFGTMWSYTAKGLSQTTRGSMVLIPSFLKAPKEKCDVCVICFA